MYPIERRQAILDILEKRTAVNVTELSRELFIGEATIRRDLEKLSSEGQIQRTHGGAVKLLLGNTEVPFLMRESSMVRQKEAIAKLASELVKSGQTLFFDSSSSVLRMVTHIKDARQLTVITNGVKTAFELGQKGIKTICTGGLLKDSTTTLVGADAINAVNRFYAETFFFSCRAFDKVKGILESSDEGCLIKEAMANNSAKIVLLIDSTKFDKTAFAKLDILSKVDYIVTDKMLDEEWQKLLSKFNIKVLVAD